MVGPQITKPEAPIDSELLQYCEEPELVSDTDLIESLAQTTRNSQKHYNCRLLHKGLVDAVNRRNK